MPTNGPNAQIIEVRDRQVFLGQEILNVYWYRLDSTSSMDLTAFEVTFENTVIGAVVAFQSDQLEHVDVTVINHSDPTKFGTFAANVPGERTPTDLSAPFIACGVRFNRSSRELRNGQKRYGGFDDGTYTNGFFDSSVLALVAAAMPDVLSTLTESIRNYVPVVVRNKPTTTDLTIDPEDPSTWKYVTFTGATIKNAVTTQNSRKF